MEVGVSPLLSVLFNLILRATCLHYWALLEGVSKSAILPLAVVDARSLIDPLVSYVIVGHWIVCFVLRGSAVVNRALLRHSPTLIGLIALPSPLTPIISVELRRLMTAELTSQPLRLTDHLRRIRSVLQDPRVSCQLMQLWCHSCIVARQLLLHVVLLDQQGEVSLLLA